MAITRVPDEMLLEIISPLLKHPDKVFSHRSEQALSEPGYSSSTYLLVCKTWLRVSTPLLHNVVILRTTAQAIALEKVLEKNPQFGAFVRKLRVKGGFGNVMLSILKRTPSITDLFLSLSIWGADDVRGFCSGLELINPRRVILFDGVLDDFGDMKPKKNKQTALLFDKLLAIIPKWDHLEIFDFPYRADIYASANDIIDPRAEALALALGKSLSLQTLIVPVGRTFPEYLRPVTRLRSFTSLQIMMSAMMPDPLGLVTVEPDSDDEEYEALHQIRAIVDQDENLKAVVTYVPYDSDSESLYAHENGEGDDDDDFASISSSSFPHSAEAENVDSLQALGKSRGSTLHELHLDFSKKPTGRGSKAKSAVSIDPSLLAPFAALNYISWAAHPKYSFSDPAPGFTILAAVESLDVTESQSSAPFLGLCLHLPLPALREVILKTTNVPATTSFLRKHGPKLTTLTVQLAALTQVRLFDLCPNLARLEVVFDHKATLPADFISCAAPHTALEYICFGAPYVSRSLESALKTNFSNLVTDASAVSPRFPALKEIRLDAIEWPTSEHAARKNKWIPLAKMLLPAGIKLTDSGGTSARVALGE
ncbi:hypothetical protein C8R46DRAFT_1108424 [Mycena filopes]|nr:hypothetical protein C8R46DRAFT_1108424 [Mycena filopes]